MRHTFLKLTLTMAGLSIGHTVIAQTENFINERVVIFSEDNIYLKEIEESSELKQAVINEKKDWWLPELYAGFQTHHLWGAAMNTDGKFALETQRDNLWMGIGADLSLNLSEGLFAGRTVNYESKALSSKTRVERNAFKMNVLEKYFEWLSSKYRDQAYTELHDQSDSLSEQLKLLNDSGLGYESDWLLSKTKANHLKYLKRSNVKDIARTERELIQLLGATEFVEIITTDTISLVWTEEKYSQLLTHQSEVHPNITALEHQVEASKNISKAKGIGTLLPELRVGVYASKFGDLSGDLSPLVANPSPVTDQLYPTESINASLMWRIPMGKLMYGTDVKKHKQEWVLSMNRLEQRSQELEAEIEILREEMIIAKEQLELTTDNLGLAKEALKQVLGREKLGLARPYERLHVQESYLDARIDQIDAVTRYNILGYEMMVALGMDL